MKETQVRYFFIEETVTAEDIVPKEKKEKDRKRKPVVLGMCVLQKNTPRPKSRPSDLETEPLPLKSTRLSVRNFS